MRAIYHRRGKSARHRPYQNRDDFVRRLSTISPLLARRSRGERGRTDFATKSDERILSLVSGIRCTSATFIWIGIYGDDSLIRVEILIPQDEHVLNKSSDNIKI